MVGRFSSSPGGGLRRRHLTRDFPLFHLLVNSISKQGAATSHYSGAPALRIPANCSTKNKLHVKTGSRDHGDGSRGVGLVDRLQGVGDAAWTASEITPTKRNKEHHTRGARDLSPSHPPPDPEDLGACNVLAIITPGASRRRPLTKTTWEVEKKTRRSS